MKIAIKIKKLSVILGGKIKALDDIDVQLPSNKIVGIIGPSGAGKTTLIRSIVGVIKIPVGSIKIFGIESGSPELRTILTYMGQELSVYSDLTVRQNIAYFSAMSGQSRKQIKLTIDHVLTEVDMMQKADELVSDLSGGQKQRVSLAIALIGSPKVMVLDEPTVGLDPVLRENLWSLFRKIANSGVTIVVSSHSMGEASRCDDLILIRDGKIVANGSPRVLLRRTKTKTIEQAFLKLVGGDK